MSSITYIESVSQSFFLTKFGTGFVADIGGWEVVQYLQLPPDLCCHLEDRIGCLMPGVVWSGRCVFCFM